MTRWAAFVAWTSRAESPTPLALVRVAMGVSAFVMLGDCVRCGIVDALWVDRAYGGVRALGNGNWLVSALGGPTPGVMHGLVAAAMVASALLALGFGTRVMALITMITVSSVVDVNTLAGGSYDQLLENALWLLFLGPCTATLSVDCWLKNRRWTDATPRWAGARYLLIFQLVLMYWTTGLQKLSVHWVPGGGFDALYYIFQQPTWQRFDMLWVAYVYPLTQLGTAATWFWEVLSPLWLAAMWFRLTRTRGGWLRAWSNSVDLRLWYAALGLTFHALIWAFMDVGPFSPISVAFYFALIDPEEYRGLWCRISGGA